MFSTKVIPGISDHHCVTPELRLPDPVKCIMCEHKHYVYGRGDYAAMPSELESHLSSFNHKSEFMRVNSF